MRILLRYVAVALITAISCPPSVAETQSPRDLAEIVFSEVEKRIIRDYFGRDRQSEATNDRGKGRRKGKGGKEKVGKKAKDGKGGGLPPGLAKRESLPPGLQKQLERNGTLPPGLAKRDLPADLASRLPKRDSGYERVIVDDDVVLIEKATNKLLDILVEIIRGQPSG